MKRSNLSTRRLTDHTTATPPSPPVCMESPFCVCTLPTDRPGCPTALCCTPSLIRAVHAAFIPCPCTTGLISSIGNVTVTAPTTVDYKQVNANRWQSAPVYGIEYDLFLLPLCLGVGTHQGPFFQPGYADLGPGGPFGTLTLQIPAFFLGSSPKAQANCRIFPPVANANVCGPFLFIGNSLVTGGATTWIVCPP